MKTLSRFVTKFTSLIVAVLSCFDRVIFKGYLPINNGPALEGFVDHVLKIRRCDFMTFAEQQSETLVNHAKRLAEEASEFRVFRRLWGAPSFAHVLAGEPGRSTYGCRAHAS